MPPAKQTAPSKAPQKTEKPVAGSNWFRPWLKPLTPEAVKKAPLSAVKATPQKKTPAAGNTAKTPKTATKAAPKKVPAAAGAAKKGSKTAVKAIPKKKPVAASAARKTTATTATPKKKPMLARKIPKKK